ncbi:MAG: sulfatase-like hydrolase/transferase, partial [Rikenellaceae bacterium]
PVLEKGDDSASIFSRWTLTKEFPFYSEQLAAAGYKNIHIGKWHVVGPYPKQELATPYPYKEHLRQPDSGDYSWVADHREDDITMNYYPEGRGYLKNVGGTYRGDPALEPKGYKGVTGGYYAPFPNPFIDAKSDDEWLTDRLTDEAIAFMAEHRDEPFFVNLHYYTVHAPVRKRSEGLYDKYINKEGDPVLGQGEGKTRKYVASYATMIESLDDNFGRMVAYLEQSGLADNTIIVFSSDNGYAAGANRLLRGKKLDIYEGGVRVPTFVYWKGKVQPRHTQVPISILDFFPTFLSFASIDNYDGVLDGVDITPLLTSDAQQISDRPIFWQLNSVAQNHGTCTAMRLGDYKIIEFLADGKVELYNLKDDPREEHNLAREQSELAACLLAKIKSWRRENEVPLPPNAVVDNN